MSPATSNVVRASPTKHVPTGSTQPLKVITKAEVVKHNTPDDAWVMHNGYVYDITVFIREGKHPGGNGAFDDCLGKNVEEEMDATDHSPFAYQLIKEYVIGTVDGEKQVEKFPVCSKQMRGYEVADVRDAIDVKKPLLSQVAKAGDKYWPWMINRPVVERLEIFDIKFIEENLSRWPWWIIWVIFPPIILWHLGMAFTEPESDGGCGPVNGLISVSVGMVGWTLMEYFLHRFVFHMEAFTNIGNVVHFFAHGVHHLTPADSSRLTFPPPLSLAIAVFFHNFLYYTVPNAFLSWYAVYAGLAFGYIMYDTAHYFFHHTDFNNRLFRFCKSAHLGHHYKNEDMNFGVTSPIWDLVFGTYDPYNTSSDNKKVQ